MSDVKRRMTEIIESQPEDSTYEEILRELAFDRMVERGLADSRADRTLTHEDVERRIRTWSK